jgi:hypothetical protein
MTVAAQANVSGGKLQDRVVRHRLAVLVLDAGGGTGFEIRPVDPLQRAIRVVERMLERDHARNLIVAVQFQFVALQVVLTIVEAILVERGRITITPA